MESAFVCAALARAPGLTAEHVRALAAAADHDLRRLCERAVLDRVSLPPAARRSLGSPNGAALRADLEWCTTHGARLLSCIEDAYPGQLAAAPGAPPVLYVLGSVEALKLPQLAMVGSRRPTPAGRAIAREFATALARSGLTITSGLAVGIDAACHEAALSAGGSTVAVLATGLDRTYPAQHAELAGRIRRAGALVSEFPPGTRPRRGHFPRRNRIISALSLGALVVEATEYSGSLITARCAADQGREVFAVPGPIASPLSRGCHRLIREGAHLVETPGDVLSEIQFHHKNQLPRPIAAEPGKPVPLDKEYEMLLDAFGFEPVTFDTLVARSGLSGESIASMLLILELQGRVAPYPGGRFGRLDSD